MAVIQYEIRPGAYYDSVVLMHLQHALIIQPGILDAGAVMATSANLELLAQSNILPDGLQAGADDLVIVVSAEAEPAAAKALSRIDELIASRRSTNVSDSFRPRSLESAVSALPAAQWVLISVPGRYAADVARQSLDLGKHVFLYSDNVSIEDEIDLKQRAQAKGLLVMGPDCGTAIINGVGLGFANRVRRGNIGIVAASGTGLQAVSVQIHNMNGGISHAIGTGGRDLKADVSGITAMQALEMLRQDHGTSVIVLVSKPPDPTVAARLLAAAQRTGKPVIASFIGYPAPVRQQGNVYFAANLSEAASLAIALSRVTGQIAPEEGHSIADGERRYLRGLFSGGTLAYEALRLLDMTLSPLYSNIPMRDSQRMADPLVSQGHTILDLGEDVFTVGRLHPMMDNDLRLRRMQQEAEDPEVAVILMDVVLGEGAHPNPASDLAPAIAQLRADYGVEVVVVLVGTDEDPQDFASQHDLFIRGGAIVFDEVLDAVEHVNHLLGSGPVSEMPRVDAESLNTPLAAINVGLELFYDSLIGQGAEAVHVEWRPPAGGNEKLMSILDKMKNK